jgi:hypothetical protein
MNIQCSQLCKTPTRKTELPFYRPCMPLKGFDSAPRHEDVWWSGCIVPRILKNALYVEMSDQLNFTVGLTPRSLCAHQIKGWMGPRAGVTVDDLVKKKISWPCRESNPPVLRFYTHTLATMPITLLGVGQTVEDTTCRSLTWILKQFPGVAGVDFLWGAELSCLDCLASALNARDLFLRWAVDQDTVLVACITSEHNVIQVQQCVHRLLEWRKPKDAEWGYVLRSWKWLTNSRNTMSCFVFV